jgi:hypothetical protein
MRLLITLGDLVPEAVEGRVRCRQSRAWLLASHRRCLILFRHLLHSSSLRWESWPQEECESAALRRWRLPLTLVRKSVAYGESVAGSPVPDRFNRTSRSSTSRSHLFSWPCTVSPQRSRARSPRGPAALPERLGPLRNHAADAGGFRPSSAHGPANPRVHDQHTMRITPRPRSSHKTDRGQDSRLRPARHQGVGPASSTRKNQAVAGSFSKLAAPHSSTATHHRRGVHAPGSVPSPSESFGT